MLVVVPNEVRDAINVKLDAALAKWPNIGPREREVLFREILAIYDEQGTVPEFDIVKQLPA